MDCGLAPGMFDLFVHDRVDFFRTPKVSRWKAVADGEGVTSVLLRTMVSGRSSAICSALVAVSSPA